MRSGLPGEPGVYRFRDGQGRVLYVGRATDLRSRVNSYWGGLGDRRHLRRMVPRIARVEAVSCDSVHEAAWLERNLLERSKPRWNRIRGGLEVPVCIRLTHEKGLTVDHWKPGRSECFGPYLGGTRVRLAVSGLERVLPLRYTEERLGGGLRDLGRLRGVDPGDRASLLVTLSEVLRRAPAATDCVREMLALKRESAAGHLAFELAARIHDELAAIDWIVAEQKVTSLDGSDHDICGWADGLLVRFRMRGGRLSAWEQRPCGREAARRHVEQTPAAWTDFAARNAELARRLLP